MISGCGGEGVGGGGPCCPPTPPCLVGFPPGCSAQISSSVPTTPQRVSAHRQIGVIRCFRISSTSLISWQKSRLHCGVRRGQKIFFMRHPNPCSACAVIVALHAGNHPQSLLFHLLLQTPAGLHGPQRRGQIHQRAALYWNSSRRQ